MDHLRRELAPISDRAWEYIEGEARRTFRHFLAARPVVQFTGPLGWDYAAHRIGRVHPGVPSPSDGVVADIRDAQALVELRTAFELSVDELDAADRGADPDLAPLIEAAKRLAMAEDRAVFHGYEAAGIAGITPSSPHEQLTISDDYNAYPSTVARAAGALRAAGVAGPYGIALGPRCYTGVIETTEHGGYPVLDHLKLILGGPVLWAPAVNGAVVVSLRGGDYELVCGQDVSIGYRTHTDVAVELYFEETMTFVVHDPRAAVGLVYPD